MGIKMVLLSQNQAYINNKWIAAETNQDIASTDNEHNHKQHIYKTCTQTLYNGHK